VQHKEIDMKTTVTKWATKAAGAGAVALLLATPAFAQSRGDWSRNTNSNRSAQSSQTRGGNRGQYDRSNQTQNQAGNRSFDQSRNNSSRENQRVTTSGRITSFNRESNGYRVQLDRGQGSYWIPESRGRGLRAGLSINLGGIFRGGSIFVDTVGYPAGYGYDNGYVRGVIDRVDYRTGTVLLHDEASGREIRADVGSGYALRDLHSGEFVELTGQWIAGGVFDVARIANVAY
jgi:hypothetical protein